ncbi:MAG: hypothetical protein SCALA702_34030 [Melioribacteraceae bacterium]|nr:MAG: hypothetical protein SCALA702_34030 [Melioribacteraceae bacterium]
MRNYSKGLENLCFEGLLGKQSTSMTFSVRVAESFGKLRTKHVARPAKRGTTDKFQMFILPGSFPICPALRVPQGPVWKVSEFIEDPSKLELFILPGPSSTTGTGLEGV